MNALMNIGGAAAALTMSSREIAELVGSRHDSVKRTIETLASKGVIQLPQTVGVKNHLGQTVQEHLFAGEQGKRDSIVVVAQLSPEFTARLVDRWQELEAAAAVKSHVTLPRNFAEALRLAADLEEQKQLAEMQRDEAVATKALIGQRREATAMNTASQAIKKAARLEVELDRAMRYATVKRMEMLYHGQKFNWRLLKSTATQMEMPPIDVFDSNYGTVKAYHADVWREAYAIDIPAANPPAAA